MMLKMPPRLMDDAIGGAAGGAAPAAPAAAPAPAAPSPAPAAPAPAPASTVLSSAAPAAPAAPAPWNAPDKYLVKTEAGEVDWQATARKIDDGRSHLEKRMGSGDVPPADVAGYKIEAPADVEALKGWNPAEDAKLQAFLGDAHKAGFTQKQVDLVMSQYARLASESAGMQLSPEQAAKKAEDDAAKALGEVWKDPAEFDKNVGAAFAASQKLAAKIGADFDQFNEALGNNPMFLRLAAALAPEMGEDVPQGTVNTPAETLDWDAKRAELAAERDKLPAHDPRRAQVVRDLDAHYKKRYPG